MIDPIRNCENHGPFAGRERCPVCGERAPTFLSGERRRRLSKFLSGALRHFPEDVGIELDDSGWTAYEELVGAVGRNYDWADARHVAAVVETDPKGRFERTTADGTDLIRASYGHSVDVDLEPTEGPVPDELYHGTAPGNLDSIREEGLRPMGRQQVHLSGSREAARTVGGRHAADPVVLVVDARGMLDDSHRIAKRGRETYTTEAVPPRYLSGLPSDGHR